MVTTLRPVILLVSIIRKRSYSIIVDRILKKSILPPTIIPVKGIPVSLDFNPPLLTAPVATGRVRRIERVNKVNS
jgi:hypothetical protein